MFRIDGVETMHKSDLTITTTNPEVVQETINIITGDIMKYIEKHTGKGKNGITE